MARPSPLRELRPHVELALARAGQPTTTVLENHSASPQADIDAFNRLNDPHSPHRVILLVNKGTEGWNCPSLFATALARKLRTARLEDEIVAIPIRRRREDRPARIYLSDANRVKPPDQLGRDEGPGALRKHDILAFPDDMRPPPFTDVHGLVTDWIEQANAAPGPEEHLLEQLARLHARFEQIHPFRDGNGRAGRLALNLLLVRRGYAPATIYKRDRSRYLAALRRADRGNHGSLAELLARAVKDGVDRFLLPALAGPHRLLPLPALADADLSLLALRRAAQEDRLRATHLDGRWYSTRRDVDAYKRTRRRGRRRVIE